ncbi:MAG: 30S ribosomal protein S21 [Candidatus Tyrphobacter sp.]
MTSSFDRRPYADAPIVRVDGSLEAALRELGKRCAKAGIPQDLKRAAHFVSRSNRRRTKSRRARVRQRGTF